MVIPPRERVPDGNDDSVSSYELGPGRPTHGSGPAARTLSGRSFHPPRMVTVRQLVVIAVSSITKLVWSEESSVPVNFRVTVWPA